MSYFKYMPVATYQGDGLNEYTRCVDITVRARILEFVKNSQTTVVDYTLKDGERPEHISQRVYDRPDYHWIVLLYNEIHDPYFDWPMSTKDLDEMISKKYGGRAYFVDLKLDSRDGDEYDNTIPKIAEEFWFESGLTATIGGVTTGKVLEWNPNLCKLVVDSDSPGTATYPYLSVDDYSLQKSEMVSQTRSDGTLVQGYVKRIVDDNRYSVHHFVKSETGEILDHHFVPSNADMLRDLGTNSDCGVGSDDSDCASSYLDRYIKNRQNIIELNNGTKTVVAVTNYEYEIEQNDAKRNIKVLRPQFAELVAKDIKKVFTGG